MKNRIAARFVKSFVIVLNILSLLLIPPQYAFAEDEDITEAGDWLQIILPAAAGASTLVAGDEQGRWWDREGTKQYAKAFASTIGTVHLGKAIFSKARPGSESRTSFPSGHTASAFSGASFFGTRYGWKWGIPAYAAAAFTGYSRIQADAHFADDVTAGASVAMMYNWLFITPKGKSNKPEPMALMPLVAENTVGLNLVATDISRISFAEGEKAQNYDPRFRYDFSFSPAFIVKNKITVPADGGTTFDLDSFRKDDNPTTTASVGFDFFLDDRNTITLFWNPFESQDRGTFTEPVSFAGALFPANQEVFSRWRLYEGRVIWQYNLTPEKPLDLKVGLGAMGQHIKIKLATTDGAVSSNEEDFSILPLLLGTISYPIIENLSISAHIEGIYLDQDWFLDVLGSLNYRISNHWDVTAGYSYYARAIDTSSLNNEVAYSVPYLAVAYSW